MPMARAPDEEEVVEDIQPTGKTIRVNEHIFTGRPYHFLDRVKSGDQVLIEDESGKVIAVFGNAANLGVNITEVDPKQGELFPDTLSPGSEDISESGGWSHQ